MAYKDFLILPRETIIQQRYYDQVHFIVEENGMPMVVIIPIDEYEKFIKAENKPM